MSPLKNEEVVFSGFLNLLKPPGMTSAHAVSVVRRLFRGAKVGHAGTLDPEAAGVLPLMIGKTARLFDLMQDKEKAYLTEVAFGCATDTQDAQGSPVSFGNSYPDEAAIRSVLPSFTGEILQTPPMYSALKQDGRRLYDLARKGQQADIPARPVNVYELTFRGLLPNHGALLYLRCSKGFYVRTLCRDLGAALGCPSHMRFLLRTQTGPFSLENAHTLEELFSASENGTLADLLLPPEAGIPHVPVYTVPAGFEKPVRNGGRVPWNAFASVASQAAADGSPFGLRMNGALCAIARREEQNVRIITWLGES